MGACAMGGVLLDGGRGEGSFSEEGVELERERERRTRQGSARVREN